MASVVQMTHLLLQQAGVAKIMTEGQICATYYSALTHDFEHLGVNNDYLIKSFHPLAVMYNDISPLENHHLAAAVRVMQRPECRFVKVRAPLLLGNHLTLMGKNAVHVLKARSHAWALTV